VVIHYLPFLSCFLIFYLSPFLLLLYFFFFYLCFFSSSLFISVLALTIHGAQCERESICRRPG